MAMGEIGMTPDVFWNMRPCDFGLTVRGYRKKVKYEYERGWIYSRELIAATYNVNRSSKSRPVKGKDIKRLSFDGPEKPVEAPTNEEDQQMRDRISKALAELQEQSLYRNN